MRRLILIFAAVLTASCATISRSMRNIPVAETPDLGAAVFDSIDINWRPLARTLALQGKMLPVSGNSIEIFTDGRSKFAAFNNDLRNAEHSIDMEYYRFAADTIAGVVKDILMDKAEAGVPVRMILESRSNAPKVSFYRQLRGGGVRGNLLGLDKREQLFDFGLRCFVIVKTVVQRVFYPMVENID